MEPQEKPKDFLAHIIITQSICVALILLTVIMTKYFFKNTFVSLKEWYNLNICSDTNVNEVLEKYEI